MQRIYLDWASAAPVSLSAAEAFQKALSVFGNPSSPHAEGDAARRILEDARKRIATLAGTKPDSVIFTSGATEANNISIQGYIHALENSGLALTSMHVLYMPTAHSSVVEPLQALAKRGLQIEALTFIDGILDMQTLAAKIQKDTVLVCVDLVCGETGIIYDTREIRRVLDVAQKRLAIERIVLQVDASQAPLVESYEHTHLGADFITLDAQKVGGVRGIGALIRPRTLTAVAPIMYGGGQEQAIRPGTENPGLATAFATALEEVAISRVAFIERASAMRKKLLFMITTVIPDALVISGKEQSPHIVNISFPGRDTDYAVMLLSEKGYSVSTKSACETDEIGSRTILALTNDESRALSTLRISWGPSTAESDLTDFTRELIQTIQFLDATALQPVA